MPQTNSEHCWAIDPTGFWIHWLLGLLHKIHQRSRKIDFVIMFVETEWNKKIENNINYTFSTLSAVIWIWFIWSIFLFIFINVFVRQILYAFYFFFFVKHFYCEYCLDVVFLNFKSSSYLFVLSTFFFKCFFKD